MLLELRKIKKYFPVNSGAVTKPENFVRAVDGVDLAVSSGQSVGLVGESGCGKTTLARILLRLLPFDSGQIIFEGQDISSLPANQLRPIRKNLQIVFQDPYNSLDPRFTIRRILYEAMMFDKMSSKKDKDQKAYQILSEVGLKEDILGRFAHEFSGGERQRIAIARSLLVNPKLLILDEAVSALDVLIQQQIISLLLRLQEKFNLTYLFISHNLRAIKRISSKIAVMYQGKIVECASTDEIFRNPLHAYTKQLLDAAIHYRVQPSERNILIKKNAQLIDRGNNHFVIE